MSDKTPLEQKVDELDKVKPTDVLTHHAPLSEYCSGCGARRGLCWCGQSRSLTRSDYKGDRR